MKPDTAWNREWTFEGWFAFCPVLAREGNDGGMDLRPRWLILEPLLWLATQFQGISMRLISLHVPEHEPAWMIRLRPRRQA